MELSRINQNKKHKKNCKYKSCINILLSLILFSIFCPFCFSKDKNIVNRKLEDKMKLQ